MVKSGLLSRENQVQILEHGPYGGIIQWLEYPAFTRTITVRVRVPLPYKNILKCLGQADVADYSSGQSWVGRFNSCGVCFYMVKQE